MRLIDAYADQFDVTDTRVVLVDADPAAVLEALEHLDLAAPATSAIRALGIANRIALAPTLLDAGAGAERVYGLVWRIDGGAAARIEPGEVGTFAGPGHVKVFWDVRVRPGAESGSTLSSTARFVATDAAAREHLAAAWGIVGAVSAVLSRRALTTLKRYAEREHSHRGLALPDRRGGVRVLHPALARAC